MKRKDVILYLFSAVLFIFTAYICIGGFLKQSSLRNNGKDIDAVIVNFSTGPRGSHYAEYHYIINNIKYEGSGRYYPKIDALSIGDTIVIVYDKTNLSSSKPLRDF